LDGIPVVATYIGVLVGAVMTIDIRVFVMFVDVIGPDRPW
jgi:hypothetical protein